jgi:protein TonB
MMLAASGGAKLPSDPSWRRRSGVALAAAMAGSLHGAALVWYWQGDNDPSITPAMPLPSIDIALAAPPSPAPPQPAPAEPVPPKPEPPPPKPKAKPKPKPLPRPQPAKPEPRQEETQAPEPAPAAASSVNGSHAEAPAERSESSITQAHANADYLRNPRPVYPSLARYRHWEGLVLLRAHVLADGHCDEVNLQRSSGHEVLDEAALEAVRQWSFVPSRHGSTAVASWVTVPIEFQLR